MVAQAKSEMKNLYVFFFIFTCFSFLILSIFQHVMEEQEVMDEIK